MPGRPALEARIAGRLGVPLAIEAPEYEAPLPRVTPAAYWRSWVPAATVISHGLLCATLDAAGPLLPADAATKTPASAAKRNATSTGSTFDVREPLTE